MLDHPTLDQLKTLRLDGMAEAFAEMQKQDGTAGLIRLAVCRCFIGHDWSDARISSMTGSRAPNFGLFAGLPRV